MKSIQIDSLNGKNFNIQLDDFANDSMIHEKIADTLNIPIEEQTLIPVKDDEYLLVPKMKGGVIFLAGKALSVASKLGKASKKVNKAAKKVKKTAKKAKKLSKKKDGMFSFSKKGKGKNKNRKKKNDKKKKKNNSDSESNSKHSSDTESTEDSESSTESESSKTVSTDKSSSPTDEASVSTDKSSSPTDEASDDQSSVSSSSNKSDKSSSVSEKSEKSNDSSKKSLFSYKRVSFSTLESIDKNGLYFCLVVSLAMLLTTIFSNSLKMVFIGNVIIFFSLFLSQKRFFLSGNSSYYKRINLISTLIYLFFNTIFYLIIHFTKKSKITQIIFSLLSLLPIPYLFLIRN